MSNKPFLCPKCGNWYTPVPVAEGDFCFSCAEGKHAPHLRTGVIDCHFGHQSATSSETKMAQLLELCMAARRECQEAMARIARSGTRDAAEGVLLQAENAFNRAELGKLDMPDILAWAGVMEMPGMKGERTAVRFKGIDSIEELVGMNRRPPEDLATLRRSVKMCREMAEEVSSVLAEARVALGGARQAHGSWAVPAADVPRKAKTRVKTAKHRKVAVAV